MEFSIDYLIAAIVIALFMGGVALFHSPETARKGTWLLALGWALAVGVVLFRHPPSSPELLLIAILAGGAIGVSSGLRTGAVGVPAMIAFQHGAGGLASFDIAYHELVRPGADWTTLAESAAVLAIIFGAVTFTGSLVAAGKLARKIRQQPVFLPGHAAILIGLLVLAALLSVFAVLQRGMPIGVSSATALMVICLILGVIFTIRVGGADMPIVISFFNATAGIAASFLGIVVGNYALIGGGAAVAASGSMLTIVMLRAINRSLLAVFSGIRPSIAEATNPLEERVPLETGGMETLPFEQAIAALKRAKDVIIAPGYGMALSEAQEQVHRLENWLEERGARVRYAIHPVAGRMPGHMNVVLAEVEVGYDKLFEMEAINDDFKQADLAIVIGACDVVNPAASTRQGTPISGMPILKVHEANTVIVLNYDEKPGFSGVENPLYEMKHVITVWGDAKANLNALFSSLQN
jgi:NAD(P) transhydrogenase subunit beta